MIKLFRKIRYNLMESGKTSKYLKYAIGEIILVVIGILIALQINNWNESRKDDVREARLKTELIQEFERDLKQLESKIFIRERIISSCLNLIIYSEMGETANLDSIRNNIPFTTYRPTFDPISVEFIDKNNIDLIKNDTLRRLLTAWKVEVVQLREDELNWVKYVTTYRYNQEFLMQEGLTRDLQNIFWKSNGSSVFLLDQDSTRISILPPIKNELDYHKVLQSPFWETYCTRAIQLNADANINSMTLKRRIEEIIVLLKTK